MKNPLDNITFGRHELVRDMIPVLWRECFSAIYRRSPREPFFDIRDTVDADLREQLSIPEGP